MRPATQILRSLRQHPEEWHVADIFTIVHESGTSIWISNGFWFLDVYRPYGYKGAFNFFDKLVAFYIIQKYWGHWHNWILLLAFGLPNMVMRSAQTPAYVHELFEKVGFSRTDLSDAVEELISQMPRSVALTSDNPVIRFFAAKQKETK